MPATFYQHPSAKAIMDDPREPPHPPAESSYDPLTPEQLDVLDIQQGLENLMARYGAKRVMRIVRFLALINGEDVS